MIRKGVVFIFTLAIAVFMVLPAAAKDGCIRIVSETENITVHRLGGEEASGFRLLDTYGGGYLTFDDTLSPELAKWFSGKAVSGISGQRYQEWIVFEGLSEGLYLVKSEEGVFAPFLVSIPWDGYQWDVEVDPTNAAMPQTGDAIAIAMFAMAASGAGIALIGRKKC